MTAAAINTVLWGGVRNPMIPIAENDELARQLVRLYRVDALHPVAEAPEVKAFFVAHPHLTWHESVTGESGLFRTEASQRWLNAIDMLAWYQEATRPLPKSLAYRVVDWDETDPLAFVFSCAFGKFLSEGYRQAYVRGRSAESVGIPLGGAVPESLASAVTPLGTTRGDLVPDLFNPWSEPGIYVGNHMETKDLIAFWNIRAAGAGLVFCPVDAMDRVMDFVAKRMEWWIDWARKAGSGVRRLGLWASRGQTVPQRVKDLYPGDVWSGQVEVDEVTWNGMNVKPPVYQLESESLLANLDVTPENPPSMDFHLSPIVDLRDLPVASRRQQFVVSISTSTEFGYDGYTLRLPYLPDLNEWFSREAVVEPYRLRVGTESVGIIRDLYDQTAHLWPVRVGALVSRVLERAGIQSEPSHNGRIAQQLIAQMGGLEGCRVFKIRGVRKLITSDTAREGITRGSATEKIYDKDPALGAASFTRYKMLFIEGRPQTSADEVFNYLLRKGIFRPGLKLVCPKCTLDFWAAMPLSETCTCEYCGHSFLLAPFLKDRGDWQFRLSGLFGRKAGEEGSIPVALTLLQLLRLLGAGETLIYACNTDLTTLKCEVDLVVLSRGDEGHTEIALGECKGAGEIEDKDLQNILAAGRLLTDSGLDFYPLFAKTSDSFSDAEIARFRGLLGQGVEPILFTARELEPYHPYYDHPDRGRLRDPHAGDLRSMARNSRVLYLN